MAKNKRKQLHHDDRVLGEINKMLYKDLQRACIVRGIDFNLLVSNDWNSLSVWLTNHFFDDTVTSRLDDFDKWREDFLEKTGRKGEPFVRLGYIGTTDEDGQVISIKRPRSFNKPKDRRERDDKLGGIFKGTKKALTYQCADEGKTIEQTAAVVKEKFPEANTKSINIWYKRYLRSKKK